MFDGFWHALALGVVGWCVSGVCPGVFMLFG